MIKHPAQTVNATGSWTDEHTFRFGAPFGALLSGWDDRAAGEHVPWRGSRRPWGSLGQAKISCPLRGLRKPSLKNTASLTRHLIPA